MANEALARLRRSMGESSIDLAVVSHLPHIQKLVGFSGSNGLLLVSPQSVTIITDGRYSEQVEQQVPKAEKVIATGSPVNAATSLNTLRDAPRIAVQGRFLTAADLQTLIDTVSIDRIEVKDAWLAPVLAPKSPHEIESIRKAQSITDEVFAELPQLIEPGISEKELAAEIVYRHLKKGASKMSFDPIVAFGSNSSLPHARPGDRTLLHGEPILVDFGCVFDGYCSDMTRMLHLGEPDDLFMQLYSVVRDAKARALAAVRSGITCKDLDQVARDIISGAGYADNFMHSLGHGVGLEIHEWPSISARSDDLIPAGAVITIEPGIYLPRQFGIRIEDLVVVHESGCTNLTSSSSDLVILD